MACGRLKPLTSRERLLSPIIRFGIEAFGFLCARALRPSSQRRGSLVSRAARRSLKAPDSGSGNARRKASPTWPAACVGSIGARRAARSAGVGLSTIPRPGNRFQNLGSLSEVPKFSIPIGAKWLRFSAISGPGQRVSEVLLEAPKGVFKAAHETFGAARLRA